MDTTQELLLNVDCRWLDLPASNILIPLKVIKASWITVSQMTCSAMSAFKKLTSVSGDDQKGKKILGEILD